MTMRILHCADLHLGRRPFNLEARFDDFGRVFLHIADRAIDLNADILLIAGDFFDKRDIDAAILSQALNGLRLLKDAGVQVAAIEGNHDKAFRRTLSTRLEWLRYLSSEGMLHLLHPSVSSNGVQLPAWDEPSRSGAILEIGGVRLVGLGYRGAQGDAFLEQVDEALPFADDLFTILMFHSGVGEPDGFIMGSVSKEALARLDGRVQIAALGHWHRRRDWQIEGFKALMPGSPEVCDIREAGYERGFFLIDTPDDPKGAPQITFEKTPFRPHERIQVNLDGCQFPSAAVSRASEEAAKLSSNGEAPAVELTLTGELKFDAIDIPIDAVREAAQEASGALHVEVVNRANLPASAMSMESLQLHKRDEIERQALYDLVNESGEYAGSADLLMELAVQLKDGSAGSENDGQFTEEAIDLLILAVKTMESAETDQEGSP